MHDSKKVSKLLLDICKCPNIKRAAKDKSHPCHRIFEAQKDLPCFHLPEPWNGDLVNAPLLIISSNPSIGEDEEYPTCQWEDDKKEDFFVNRFSGHWTCDRNPLLSDGTYGKQVKFWNEIHKQAKRAFGREVEAGKDYAITEVVHCKSRNKKGFDKAVDECGGKWIEKIIAKSGSRVIMALGPARYWLRKHYNISDEKQFYDPLFISGRERAVLFVGSPGSNEKRKLDVILSKEQKQHLNSLLS